MMWPAESFEANCIENRSVQDAAGGTVKNRPRFDGCASTGDIVNYKWMILSAPEKMHADASKVIRETEPNCALTLDAEMEVDEVGLWEIQLEVRDGEGNTSVDTVLGSLSLYGCKTGSVYS